MILGQSLEARERTITELAAQPVTSTHGIPFQGEEARDFPKRLVRIDMPKYRVENGRTSIAQREFTVQQGLQTDFFSPARAEEEEVQQAQHNILLAMARSSRVNLLKFFKDAPQNQPFILDSAGFVVNGNRRLAALRTLYEEDPTRYVRFSHIQVIILPPCDQRDIDELEARLQFDEDIKDDYSWAAEAFTIRSKSDHYTPEELARIYRKTPKELTQLLERLDMAEAYLARRQKDGQYHRVERAEEAFKQLQRTSRKLTDSPAKEAFLREVAYTLIEDPAGDRVYAYIPKALSILDNIRTTLASEVLQAPPALPPHLGEIDLFGNPAAEPSDQVYQQATTALMGLDESRAAEVADVIKDCIEHYDREERDRRRSNYVADKIREANTALQDALGGIDESQERNGVAAQLDSIDHSVASLRRWATAARR
jgi:hypothetical protein